MLFTTLTEPEYTDFWQTSPQKHFLNSPQMAHLNENERILFYGVKDDRQTLAAAMIRGTKTHLGQYNYYSPRGILLDYHNRALLTFFVQHLKHALQQQHGYVLRIEPNLLLVERDINGAIVPGGIDNRHLATELQSLGFLPVPYVENISQITWQFVLPVKGQTEDTLLAHMKPNTRRRLKQAIALGIKTKLLSLSELDSFYRILQATGATKHFSVRDLSYFQKMYRLFGKDILFVSAAINPATAIESLEHLLSTTAATPATTKREIRDQADQITSLQHRIAKLTSLFPHRDDREITLASGMFLAIQPEILHLFGGNAPTYLQLDAQYVLQWEMIKRALHQNFARYNFYGIPRGLDPSSPSYGVYEFKRGFSGTVEELFGEFELPLSNLYHLKRLKTKLAL